MKSEVNLRQKMPNTIGSIPTVLYNHKQDLDKSVERRYKNEKLTAYIPQENVNYE